MRPAIAVTLASFFGVLPAVCRSQELPRQVVPAATSISAPAVIVPAVAGRAVPVLGSVAGAAVGGVIGFYAGGMIGLHLGGGEKICGDDPCGFVGYIVGSVLGEVVGIGLGAHLGAGARGRPVSSVGASLGVLILGAMASNALDESAIVIVPLAQIAAAVWMELRTARRHS